MTRPKLPDEVRRIAISVSVSPAALEVLDGIVCSGEVETRSRAVELMIWEFASRAERSKKG